MNDATEKVIKNYKNVDPEYDKLISGFDQDPNTLLKKPLVKTKFLELKAGEDYVKTHKFFDSEQIRRTINVLIGQPTDGSLGVVLTDMYCIKLEGKSIPVELIFRSSFNSEHGKSVEYHYHLKSKESLGTDISKVYLDEAGEVCDAEILAEYDETSNAWDIPTKTPPIFYPDEVTQEIGAGLNYVYYKDDDQDSFQGEISSGCQWKESPKEGDVSPLTPEKMRLADHYFKVMSNEGMSKVESNGQHLNPKLKEALQQISKLISWSYEAYWEYTITEEEKSAIPKLDQKEIIGMGEIGGLGNAQLMTAIKKHVATFLVQTTQGEDDIRYEKLSDRINNLVTEGLKRYLEAYKTDVPLYDKLYEELDKERLNGRNLFEIYLGRDGVYAFFGRKALDLARRRNLGWKERRKLRESGDLVEIRPKYLVYPRLFRDSLTTLEKKEYLESRKITTDQDWMFFDTGYVGSIPEDIMRTMGFQETDMDDHIKLLSANNPSRRVRGINDSVRDTIVNQIEHNAKDVNSAEGLSRNARGKLEPIEKLTSPEEQFAFKMIREAIVRHFWLKKDGLD